MPPTYNDISGRALERIAALSDGLFAIAMTIIVLDIRLPDPASIRNDAGLLAALATLAPQIVTYLMSFLTLGIFWVGQQTQLSHLRACDRNLAWLHLTLLAVVALLPFATKLLAEFITLRAALLLYWANLLLLGAAIYATWAYAARAGLVRDDAPPAISRLIRKRIVVYQLLYAVAAALCAVNTYWSIGLLGLLQLNSAIAPRITRFLSA